MKRWEKNRKIWFRLRRWRLCLVFGFVCVFPKEVWINEWT